MASARYRSGGVPATAEEEDGGVRWGKEERTEKEWVLPTAGSGVSLHVDAEE